MLSLQFLMLFLKVWMRKVLTRCEIVLRCRFRQNEVLKLLKCDFFALLPQKCIFTSFVKRLSKKFCIKSSLFCDFSDWKHVRTISTCKKKSFLSRKFLKTMFCYLWKIWSQSNDFYHPIFTMVEYLLRWTLLKFFNSFFDNLCHQVVPGSWENPTRSDLKGGGANPVP